MFNVYSQNKVFVQYQLFDFFPELDEFWKKQKEKIKFSRRKNRYIRIKNKTITLNNNVKEEKLFQRNIYDFVKNEFSNIINNASLNINQVKTPSLNEENKFSLVPLDKNKGGLTNATEQGSLEVQYQENSGKYHFDGYIGKYIPSTARLREIDELASPYTAGLIHMIYLGNFGIFEKLKELGIEKNGGFSIIIIFLTLYYIYFVICNSYERFTHVNSEKFSILINSLSKPKPDTIRKFLKHTITSENASKFSNFIYHGINQLDWKIGFAAYIDEHLVEYHGTRKMAKGKGGSKKTFQKGFYRFYLTCALFSIPIFNMPKDSRMRLEKVLFEVLKEYQAIVNRKIQIIIFDRGIKSFKTLKKLHENGYNFICWSFPYSTIEKALKRRHRLKMIKLSDMIKELIVVREKSNNNLNLNRRDTEIREYFENVLPINYLKDELGKFEKKEKGMKKWKSRDFIGIKDIQIEFKDYGMIRAIILEKKTLERIAVFTDIPSELAHPIEILMVLKKKQEIENYFSYKRAIQGDYIPFWELEESAFQDTVFGYEIKKPTAGEFRKFEKRTKRIKNDLNKIKIELQKWKKLFKNGEIDKKTLEKMEFKLNQNEKNKKEEIKEIRAFIKWAKEDKKPKYFEQTEPVMELNPRIEIFLNVINDLFFVNSRRIASDWGKSLKLAKSNYEVTLSDKEIKEISNYTPEKLNDILLKGGGKVLINPNNKLEILAELHTEALYKDENLIVPYLKMLNTLDSKYRTYYDTNYLIKFTYYLLRLPKLVKVV